MNDDQLQNLFREMRDEPLPADSLARVRQRVAERTAPSRWRVWTWMGSAAAVACVAALVILSIRQPAVISTPAPQPVAVRETPKPVEQPVIARVEKPAPVRQTVRTRAAKEDVLIRIETPDPDVVLFLVAEGSGE